MRPQVHILITGASGFIGRHLAELGREKGYVVYALVRKTSDTQYLAGTTLLYGDVTDYDSMIRVFAGLKADGIKLDCIIHAAAITKSYSPEEIHRVNYNGTVTLYTVLERLNYSPGKIIFVSSLAACGPTTLDAIIRKEQSQPLTAYGKSKLEAERYILQYTSIPTVILRPTAVYGPGEKDLYSVFKLVKQGFNPVFGSHQQRFTFIYVKDLSRLVYDAMRNGQPKKIYFATDGYVYSKYDLPNAIAGTLNKKILTLRIPLPLVKAAAWLSQQGSTLRGKVSALNLEKYQELIAESWVCQIEDTYTELGYTPLYNLKRGVYETSAWYKQHHWI